MLSVRYILFVLFFKKNSNLDVMSSVVKLIMDFIFTKIHSYHIIMNSINDLSFSGYYFIIVHNKPILKTINMQTFFDEMWYIVEYSIVNIFSFLVVVDWGKSKTKIFLFLFLLLFHIDYLYILDAS